MPSPRHTFCIFVTLLKINTMNTIIKKTLILLLFLSCTLCLNAEVKTYNIVSYTWGSPNTNGRKNIVWSKMKKVNYKILFDNDEKNPSLEIIEKKKTSKYKFISWDTKRTPEINHVSDGWTMREYMAENEHGHRCMIIVRENEDGRLFIYVHEHSGFIYAYGTTKDGFKTFESDAHMSDGTHIF